MGRYAHLALLLFPAASALAAAEKAADLAATCPQWAKEEQVPNNDLADDIWECVEDLKAASPEEESVENTGTAPAR
jgi:hypothetical protein